MKYKINKLFLGALTDNLYAFKNRPWELNINNTIDIFDSLGSNIKVYIYGSEVKRVLPLKNDFINEEWISNKTRYFFEGLVKWRLNIPLMKKLNIMTYVSWIQAFFFFFLKLWFYSFFYQSQHLIFLNSLFVDYELIITSKILMKKLGFLSFDKKQNLNLNDYYLYYINPNFFDQVVDKKVFFFLGYNLRLEAPILNIKIRKKCLKDNIFLYSIGSNFNDNLNSVLLGVNINIFVKYLQGKLKICNNIQKNLKKDLLNTFLNFSTFFDFNMFLIGNNIVNRLDSYRIHKFLHKLSAYNNIINLNYYYNSSKYLFNFFFFFCKKNLPLYLTHKNINIQNNLSVLYINLTSILYEELNLFNNVHNISLISKNDLLYLFGIDSFKFEKSNFLIFQGHHINSTYFDVDLILPSITFLEKSSNFLNIEGNILQTNFLLFPPIFCRNDWSILNALYIYLLNFVSKIYNVEFKKAINYLSTNHFYVQITSISKLYTQFKTLSMNFYFQNLTLYSKYIYSKIFELKGFNKMFVTLYNSISCNKSFNPFNSNIFSELSITLQNSALNYAMLSFNFQFVIENKLNISIKKKIRNNDQLFYI